MDRRTSSTCHGVSHSLHDLFRLAVKMGFSLHADVHEAEEERGVHDADGAFWVNDLGSSNGTLLNGKPVRCERLRDGDVLHVGAVKLLYRVSAG